MICPFCFPFQFPDCITLKYPKQTTDIINLTDNGKVVFFVLDQLARKVIEILIHQSYNTVNSVAPASVEEILTRKFMGTAHHFI